MAKTEDSLVTSHLTTASVRCPVIYSCTVPSRAPPPSSSACQRSSWWDPSVSVHLPSHKDQSAETSQWSLYHAHPCPSPYPWQRKDSKGFSFFSTPFWHVTAAQSESGALNDSTVESSSDTSSRSWDSHWWASLVGWLFAWCSTK